MNLKHFQRVAINKLKLSMEEEYQNIILKSPTGSGKTIILTHFMSEYLIEHPNVVFVWLTPGKGELEEQSKEKMDLYIHNAKTKILNDIMSVGFSARDCCFINWEKLNKKNNNALKESEQENFIEKINKAIINGLDFKVIIDESHTNFSDTSKVIVDLFKTDKIIKCSATPREDKTAKLIEIEERDVIAEGLIKKLVCINDNFPFEIETEDETGYLLNAALEKQKILSAEFKKLNKDINPLIVVQLPNNNGLVYENVVSYLTNKNITVENGLLAIWISGIYENIEGISKNDAKPKVIIIKQAIATGWDCPRACILAKLREGMDETFEIQTIGRIRRMPEAKHYNNALLDSCYLYTFDPKFTTGLQESLGKNALNSKILYLKEQYKDFKLIKEQRKYVVSVQDDIKALEAITKYFITIYNLKGTAEENKNKLETAGYIFADKIYRTTYSGTAHTLDEVTSSNLSKIRIKEILDTHKHGLEFNNRVSRIGSVIGLEYSTTVTILGKIFANENKFQYSEKLLKLRIKEWYSFVINNFEKLKDDFLAAMASELNQGTLDLDMISEREFFIPRNIQFTFNAQNKIQKEYKKNVYSGYLSSAEIRSNPEKLFEKFCEESDIVDWWYKNGDKGDEFFSIVYEDGANKQKLFYPDYILSIKNSIWIIETKGGFDKSGRSEDIDIFSKRKSKVLTNYLNKHNLNGGFVRYDENSMELFICIGEYNDDINSNSWKLLKNI